jgi:hypothetical protein
VRSDVPGHHRGHSHDRAFADPKRFAALAIAQRSSRSDVGEITDADVAVAIHARSKGYEIADIAVMSDVAVPVALELASDAAGMADQRIPAKHAARSHRHSQSDPGADVMKIERHEPGGAAAAFELRPQATVIHAEDEAVSGRHVAQPNDRIRCLSIGIVYEDDLGARTSKQQRTGEIYSGSPGAEDPDPHRRQNARSTAGMQMGLALVAVAKKGD